MFRLVNEKVDLLNNLKQHLLLGVVLTVLMLASEIFLFAVNGGNVQTYMYACLIFLVMASAFFDMSSRIIPDLLLIVCCAIGIAILCVFDSIALVNAFLGAIVAGVILLILYFITKGGIGMGDVKLFACCGIFLGIEKVLATMAVASVISGLFCMVMLIVNPSSRKKSIPFAPFACAAVMMTIMLQ